MSNLQALHALIVRDGAHSRSPTTAWTHVLTAGSDTVTAMLAGPPKWMLDDSSFETITETQASELLRMIGD